MEVAVSIGLPAKGGLSPRRTKGGFSRSAGQRQSFVPAGQRRLLDLPAKGSLSSRRAKGGFSSQGDGVKLAPGKPSAARGKRVG